MSFIGNEKNSKTDPNYNQIWIVQHHIHTQMQSLAYHNFSKALKNVKKLLVTGGFLKVANEQCSCGFWVELIYSTIQGPKLIFTLCFWKTKGRLKRV